MPASASIFDEGVDRVQSALRDFEGEFEKFQKDLSNRRRRFERDTEKQVKRFQRELRKRPLVKRAESLIKDATRQIENGVESVLENLQIASRADLRRIDRKLNQISKKLKELERAEPRSRQTENAA